MRGELAKPFFFLVGANLMDHIIVNFHHFAGVDPGLETDFFKAHAGVVVKMEDRLLVAAERIDVGSELGAGLFLREREPVPFLEFPESFAKLLKVLASQPEKKPHKGPTHLGEDAEP